MLKTKRAAVACVTLGILAGAIAWAEPGDKSDKPKAEPGVAAYIGGKPISLQDLDAKVLGTNMKLAQSLYDARRRALDDLIMERMLEQEAAGKGITVDKLIDERIAEIAKPVTDEEVESFYNARKSQMRGRPLEDMSDPIRQHLESQRKNEARQNLITQLKEKSDVRVTLEPPRAEVVVAASDPVLGPANAKVTIVEYADFQ